jgi:hypothetical protein
MRISLRSTELNDTSFSRLCAECAKSCEGFDDMQECAETCRRCAESWRRMAA